MDDALDQDTCEDCGVSVATVILSDGAGLCASCASIRWRSPNADRISRGLVFAAAADPPVHPDVPG